MNPDLAAILALVIYALIALGFVVRSIRQFRDGWRVWLMYLVDRIYVPYMFRCRMTNGPSPIPAEGGALILANHRSPTDPLFLWLNHNFRASDRREMRGIGFFAAAEYCNTPVINWISDTMSTIRVNRNGQDMSQTRDAIRRLKEGRLVGIFPEGKINFGTELLPANPGVAFLALKSRVPVLPMFIHDAPQIGHDLFAPFLTPCRVRVTYGKPIDLSPYYEKKTSPELLVEVTNLMMRSVAELGGIGIIPAQLEPTP